jgi:hypothetical protein
MVTSVHTQECQSDPTSALTREGTAVFWKKDKPAEYLKEVVSIHANRQGATRRATSMIPLAASGTTHEIAQTGSVRFHQLLVSLEGNQRTGCLRIISPRHKSRSAILIYRGRVVGCLYGCRKLDYQCLQQDAHKFALADLAMPGNILDAYELPEELVLAAASLFNGDVLDIDTSLHHNASFEQALSAISDSRLPGCIVVNVGEEMLCMVYVFDGRVIGVFSARDGWVKPTYEIAMSYVTRAKQNAKVLASYLPVRNREQAATIGFSLTGLGDANKQTALVQEQREAMESFSSIRHESQTYTTLEPVMKRSSAMQAKPSRQPIMRSKTANNAPVNGVRTTSTFAISP